MRFCRRTLENGSVSLGRVKGAQGQILASPQAVLGSTQVFGTPQPLGNQLLFVLGTGCQPQPPISGDTGP